jgi:hypothetical protein
METANVVPTKGNDMEIKYDKGDLVMVPETDFELSFLASIAREEVDVHIEDAGVYTPVQMRVSRGGGSV